MAGVPLRASAPVWPEIWASVRERMQLELGQGVFDTWVAPLALASAVDGHVTLAAPRRYVRDFVVQHHVAKLEAAFVALAPDFSSLTVTVDESRPAARAAAAAVQPVVRPVAAAPMPAAPGFGDREPDPQQTFATFVAGPANDFALRAAKSVAEGGSEDINLLFIHGGFGYGKTHLLNAIAHHAAQTGRGRALFLRAEGFMSKFIAALRDRDTLSFKDELRGADILLLDDLQHICGRATVSEFLHTLNAFTDGKRKLVIAADRPPAQLEGLPDDVSSRLRGALTVALEKPDAATRLAILKAKAADWERRRPRAALAEDVLEQVAAEVDGPPRELLGVFNRLATYADLTGHPVTKEFVEETISLRGSSPDRRITIEEIQKKTAEFYKLELKDLQSQCRAWRVARPRQVAMYLSRQLTARSLPDIGRRFGKRDHTTVLHACKRITALCEKDPVFQQEVDFLRRILGRASRV